MEERIRRLTQAVLAGEMFPTVTPVEYDREDLLLADVQMNANRLCRYMLSQKPVLSGLCAMTGQLRFDGTTPADVFHRTGHRRFRELAQGFYDKPWKNLVTLDWEHSAANFDVLVREGIEGYVRRIEASEEVHTDRGELDLLGAMKTVCGGIVSWAHRCSAAAADLAGAESEPGAAKRLTRLSQELMIVPEKPAGSFYEAVLSVFLCFSFLPDSLGTPDRYLYPYYKRDIDAGRLTRDEAKSILQELFLSLQAHNEPSGKLFTRGGESHFCVGGYTPDGEDGFNELSRLIVESLMELPTWIPQVSLRWTKKTPSEVFRYMMDCERHDKNKRVAFVSDEPRLRSLCANVGMKYESAVNYTMVGCNELVIQGGIWLGTANENTVRCLTTVLFDRSEQACECTSFDEFYRLYESELFRDLGEMIEAEDAFNAARAKDENVLSSIFISGCIENARSVTRGGSSLAIAGLTLIGIGNVIDSLTVIDQFVFIEKKLTMAGLIDLLCLNWAGGEDIRTAIINTARYFGNGDELSDGIAKRYLDSLYRYLRDRRNLFGCHFLVGDLVGYNPHQKWFGDLTRATPDGRHDGDALMFGFGQSEGRDRSGLTPLLRSIALTDEHCILTGPTVTNLLLDEKLIRDDAQFDKTVRLLETYFRLGGVHFQLNYVSKEDLRSAREKPELWRSLRVRVSGFSDYFVTLDGDIQDDIMRRTEISGV